MNFEQKVKDAFKALQSESPFDLPDEFEPYFRSALITVGFNAPVAVPSATASSLAVESKASAGKTKKLSGYNVFMKEKMAELKTQDVPSTERMGRVSAMWKEMGDTDKAVWKTKADNFNGEVASAGAGAGAAPKARSRAKTSTAKASGGARKLSGYQVFMKEKMAELKSDPSIPSTGRMGVVASQWKQMSDAEKETWKAKASTM